MGHLLYCQDGGVHQVQPAGQGPNQLPNGDQATTGIQPSQPGADITQGLFWIAARCVIATIAQDRPQYGHLSLWAGAAGIGIGSGGPALLLLDFIQITVPQSYTYGNKHEYGVTVASLWGELTLPNPQNTALAPQIQLAASGGDGHFPPAGQDPSRSDHGVYVAQTSIWVYLVDQITELTPTKVP